VYLYKDKVIYFARKISRCAQWAVCEPFLQLTASRTIAKFRIRLGHRGAACRGNFVARRLFLKLYVNQTARKEFFGAIEMPTICANRSKVLSFFKIAKYYRYAIYEPAFLSSCRRQKTIFFNRPPHQIPLSEQRPSQLCIDSRRRQPATNRAAFMTTKKISFYLFLHRFASNPTRLPARKWSPEPNKATSYCRPHFWYYEIAIRLIMLEYLNCTRMFSR